MWLLIVSIVCDPCNSTCICMDTGTCVYLNNFKMIFDVMNLLKGMYFYTFIVIVTSINQRFNSCVFLKGTYVSEEKMYF